MHVDLYLLIYYAKLGKWMSSKRWLDLLYIDILRDQKEVGKKRIIIMGIKRVIKMKKRRKRKRRRNIEKKNKS